MRDSILLHLSTVSRFLVDPAPQLFHRLLTISLSIRLLKLSPILNPCIRPVRTTPTTLKTNPDPTQQHHRAVQCSACRLRLDHGIRVVARTRMHTHLHSLRTQMQHGHQLNHRAALKRERREYHKCTATNNTRLKCTLNSYAKNGNMNKRCNNSLSNQCNKCLSKTCNSTHTDIARYSLQFHTPVIQVLTVSQAPWKE